MPPPPASAAASVRGRVQQALGRVHGAAYASLNASSTAALRAVHARGRVPPWLTADAVTSSRLALVVPTLALFAHGHHAAPAALVAANAVLDYVDGVVARWERGDAERAKELAQRAAARDPTRVAAEAAPSQRRLRLDARWGAYYDALADKAFAIPVWVALAVLYPDQVALQTLCLAHAGVESLSAYVRTKAYFAFPESDVVVADATGKTKQFVAMTGTTLAFFPALQPAAAGLLAAALPLAVLSLWNKLPPARGPPPRVLVVLGSAKDLAAEDVLAISAVRRELAPGTELVVGFDAAAPEPLRAALLELGSLVDRAMPLPSGQAIDAALLQRYEFHTTFVREDARARCDPELVLKRVVVVLPPHPPMPSAPPAPPPV